MAFRREVKNGQATKGHPEPDGIVVERTRVIRTAMCQRRTHSIQQFQGMLRGPFGLPKPCYTAHKYWKPLNVCFLAQELKDLSCLPCFEYRNMSKDFRRCAKAAPHSYPESQKNRGK
jgi:hypothetical protein